jgi:membrane protease YdiL (CAAX protease family)
VSPRCYNSYPPTNVPLLNCTRCIGADTEMRSTSEQGYPHSVFSLTRMIYAVCSAIILYKVIEFSGWFLLRRAQSLPWGLSLFGFWFRATALLFALTMLAVSLLYHPKSELFHWSQPTSRPVGIFRSIGFGLLGGMAAFALASPIFWLVGSRTEFIPSLIANALSPLRVLELVFFVIVLAVSSEVVYRGVVFRTLTDYANTPAAVLGSCMLFAIICPVLSFPSAIILGVASAILYYRTRSLLASITANAIFTVGGGALSLYHGLMHG